MKGIDNKFFQVPQPVQSPRDGSLLVANPFLTEKWFDRAVIFLLDHTPEGSMGVVLNLAIESTLSELVDGVTREDDVHVFCGGPLSHDNLFFLHTLGEDVIPGARPVAEGLWVGGDFDAALEYVNSGYPLEGFIRFYVGYSGWSAGQLENELKEGTWAVDTPSHITHALLKGHGEEYWHRVVRSLGPTFRAWLMLPHDSHKN